MEYTCFNLEIKKSIAYLQLNRPDEFNTMNRSFWKELPTVLNEINDKASARVVVLSSTGKHFSAGLDLELFADALIDGVMEIASDITTRTPLAIYGYQGDVELYT